jgi:transketolase N-terminal domain/subunit
MVAAPASLDTLCINSIRMLAVDAINKSNSGHPGLPMGCAPMGYALWDKFLNHNPKNPEVVQPRPLRAVRRTRLHAAVRAAASSPATTR